MICFYHRDADGRCAGAIVRKYIQEYFPDTAQKYVEIDYDQQNIIPVEIIKNEAVYIVDFHFTSEVMRLMVETTHNIFVFDHHKTGAEIIAQYPKEVECHCDSGSEFAGCELVWDYLFPTSAMPRAVELIGDRDAWKWQYGEETACFNEGLKLHPHQPVDEIWKDLLNTSMFNTLDAVGNDGKVCLKYRDAMCREFRKSWGFEAEIAGHRCYVMNLMLEGVGSEMFAEKLEEYDVCVGVVFKNGTWKISLRSNGKVDISEIAKRLGGGGHAKAAGAEGLKELPFKLL